MRALEVTVDPSVLWVGAGLAMAAAVLLAFVPRLPLRRYASGPQTRPRERRRFRITPGTSRRLRAFATTQIACSFVLLAGAGMLLTTLVSLQHVNTSYDMRHVLVFDIPMSMTGASASPIPKLLDFYQQATRSFGATCLASMASRSACSRRGATPATLVPGCRSPSTATRRRSRRGRSARAVPASSRRGFFTVVGVPLIAGRDFTNEDRAGAERVVIVSQSVAERLYPNGDALNRKMWWVDP